MQVRLAGGGGGTPDTMTAEVRAAVLEADLLVGASRLLESLPEGCTTNRQAAVRAQAVLEILQTACAEHPCVVFSGDSGFYSGTQSLVPLLQAAGIAYAILPGISSVQLLAARLGRPWQDWNLVSAHGEDCDAVGAVCGGKPAFFLTGSDPAEVCRQLAAAGLGMLPVTAGERLSYPDERIVCGTAAELAAQAFAPLAVLLVEPAPQAERRPGMPDDGFIRGNVPMTKQEVRAAVSAKLAVKPWETVWDVGAGTGSVSVELSGQARQVYAVECGAEACGLIRQNRERFCAWNLTLVEGMAPEALQPLPPPDAVFIGGTKGKMAAVAAAALAKNPCVRFCISAVALETLPAAMAALAAHEVPTEVTQIAVSRTRPAGSLHLLTANNPVFLITGRGGPR
ncbi:MAG: precorrin-6y C5,15-methyltransferase (decarboxylating) subunit CbiE [Oscillibacter sp.]|nr:precorrin-6y C5,15-methyltransferase (decarboxylating) subunit CbiE [Oscillibacter sp.]